MQEFSIIQKYFMQTSQRADVLLGPGDDCALLQPPPGQQLALTTDTLVAGVHFYPDIAPADLGYKALAVNLSDLAAMGAEPAWISLALTLPEATDAWLAGFCQGLFELCHQHRVSLVGGDLTHGPLSVTIQAYGFIPAQKALLRSNAKVGDRIYVTGTLGDAGLALLHQQRKINLSETALAAVLPRLLRPTPRIAEGLLLRDYAHAAIDISDGLAADLNHILTASQVGATIYLDQLPLSNTLSATLDAVEAQRLALAAGDDYELCFTAAPDITINQLTAYCIGVIEAQPGLRLQSMQGHTLSLTEAGYLHFK